MPRRYVCRCFTSCAGAGPARTTFQRRTIVKHLENDRQRRADLLKAESPIPPALVHAIEDWAPTAFDEIAAVIPRVSRNRGYVSGTTSDEASSKADPTDDIDCLIEVPDARARLLAAASGVLPSSSGGRKRPAPGAGAQSDGRGGPSREKRTRLTMHGGQDARFPLSGPPPAAGYQEQANSAYYMPENTYGCRYPPIGLHSSSLVGDGGSSVVDWPPYFFAGPNGPPERGYSSLRTSTTHTYCATPEFAWLPGGANRPIGSSNFPYSFDARQPALAGGTDLDLAPTSYERALPSYLPCFSPVARPDLCRTPIPGDKSHDNARPKHGGSKPVAINFGVAFSPSPQPPSGPEASASSSFDIGTFSTGSPPSPLSLDGPPCATSGPYDYVPLLPLKGPLEHSCRPHNQASWPDMNEQKDLANLFPSASVASGEAVISTTEAIARLEHEDLLRNPTYRDLFFDYLALVGRSNGTKLSEVDVIAEPGRSLVFDTRSHSLPETSLTANEATSVDVLPNLASEMTFDLSDDASIEAYSRPVDQLLPSPAIHAGVSLAPYHVEGDPTASSAHHERSSAVNVLERLWAGM